MWWKCLLFFKAEEEALLFQQYVAAEDYGQFEGRLRPYVDQVRMVMSNDHLFLCAYQIISSPSAFFDWIKLSTFIKNIKILRIKRFVFDYLLNEILDTSS